MIFHGFDPAMAALLAGDDQSLSEQSTVDARIMPFGLVALVLGVVALFALI